MQRAYKDLLRSLVMELRHTLDSAWDESDRLIRGDLDRELERIGIGTDGSITPLDALPNPTPEAVRAHRTAEVQMAAVSKAERPSVRAALVERAAYTWINRLLALRALEARGLIEETLRLNPAYEGISEALYVLRYEEPQRTGEADGGWWAVLENVCRTQAQLLPGLFDWDDPNVALRPSTTALLRCVQAVGRPELDPLFADPDAISWSYQFYQEEAKKRVYAKLGRGGKVESRSEIAAATQLFTEPYMVQWLLQNSLGRSYHEAYPDSVLPAGWDYYIDREKIDRMTEGQDDKATVTPSPGHPFPLSELTFLDPCTGSGHFQREAFDMLFAMYGEQQPEMTAQAIADRILSHHLHGIDIDPRAVQLAGVTLVLRAWEQVGSQGYAPPALNLATTPARLDPGALERHLRANPEDRLYRPILAGVFAALEQAPILGSLLKPEEHLESAIQEFRKQRAGGQTGLLAEDAGANRLLAELARHDPDELKKLLLERIARSFAQEARQSDVAAQLLGREAGEGVHLLQLLERSYAVVATNPPYMGSRNMDDALKKYVDRHYKFGKRDIYAAFILRCLDLTERNGQTAMLTQQSWMFLRQLKDLRNQVLSNNSISALAHLGRYAFSDIGNAAVQPVLFVCKKRRSNLADKAYFLRLKAPRPAHEQDNLLKTAFVLNPQIIHVHNPMIFQRIEGSPISYWLPSETIEGFSSNPLKNILTAKVGIQTGDTERFLRYHWEAVVHEGWKPYTKAGRTERWSGVIDRVIRWWEFPSDLIPSMYASAPDPEIFQQESLSYSMAGNSNMTARIKPAGVYTDIKAPTISSSDNWDRLALLNSRVVTFLLRATTGTIDFSTGYVEKCAGPVVISNDKGPLARFAVYMKNVMVTNNMQEIYFSAKLHQNTDEELLRAATWLASVEAVNEKNVFKIYRIEEAFAQDIVGETGTPAGWHPLIAGYDALPELPPEVNLPPLPSEVLDYLAGHERIHPAADELARIKANLQALYEAGEGAKDVELDDGPETADDEEEGGSGAYIPIPTETFLEDLSVNLQIHPISVYWLLEELRAGGVRCRPEEQRLLEDRLSVLVLRLLGHRWPKQMETGEPVPAWADRDGVIPITPGTGEPTLAERIRGRLRAEEGDLAAQRTEALLYELTGRTLEEWLRRDFFKRHASQFKKRPIAWHLASDPTAGGRKKSGQPVFECLLYYHSTGGYGSRPGRGGPSDILARLRTQYVDRLLAPAQRELAQARREGNETVAAQAVAVIQELEDFARRLRQVDEGGFACGELDKLLEAEALDRWAGDGVFPPGSRAELLTQEEGWQVDINDGVRVNVAPLQQAGLLVSDVLAKKEISKAIADRARWRSDERRWVRAGKLPRCGWMGDDVPESPRWTELAPEREKERLRLEEKRAKVLGELGGDES